MTEASGPDAWAAVEALARTARARMAARRSASARSSPPIPTGSARFSAPADGLLLDLSKTALTDDAAGRAARPGRGGRPGGAARRHGRRRGGEHDRAPRRAAHGAARAARGRLRAAGGRRTPRPRSPRRATGCGDFCAAVHGGSARRPLARLPAQPACPSPTWSISASAAPTSARRMVTRALWTPAAPLRARITWPMSMRMPGRRCGRGSTRRGPWCWWPPRPSPPRRP